MNSFVVYRGPSALDGQPIVGIVTGCGGNSSNPKTGPMAQLWIFRADVDPIHAQASGLDVSVCGDCPMRQVSWRAKGAHRCYVRAYCLDAAWKHNHAAAVDLKGACARIKSRDLGTRLGAYGDPAALPEAVIYKLAKASRFTTGYTHQWRDSRFAWLKAYAMASVESEADRDAAHAAGWRTFRVVDRKRVALPMLKDEIWCANKTRQMTCNACKLCDGAGGRHKKSIAIPDH